MSLTISLQFPSGRYHATIWGRHVNDEEPEWPPSPWRLLRALAAVWKQRADDLPTEKVASVLRSLASDAPQFRLPRATIGHTRHYMPERSKPTLVLDRFVAVERPAAGRDAERIYIHWPNVDLSPEERETLAALLERLTYLGRAESWCDAALMPTGFSVRTNSQPGSGDGRSSSVLVADPKTWSNWDYPPETRRAEPAWNLLAESADVQRADWNIPPGSRWLSYSLAENAMEVDPRRVETTTRQRRQPTVARFLLDAPVLPLVTETISVAEQFRRAAMSRFNAWCHRNSEQGESYRRPRSELFASSTLSGKTRDGVILTGHEHAHYLPTAEGDDPRRITHVTVSALKGFDAAEVAALSSLRTLRWNDGTELTVQLVGLGQPPEFNCDLFRSASSWVSSTPFLGPAHIGRKGRARYMRKALMREWRRLSECVPEFRGVHLMSVIERSPEELLTKNVPRAIEYRRVRPKRGSGSFRPSALYRLSFSKPFSGPLCLGYASHFGLGLFVPDDSV